MLKRLLELAGDGLKIIMKKKPEEPGAILHPDYLKMVETLGNSENVSSDIPPNLKPFLTGSEIPCHWCREDKETLYIFFPDPKSDRIKFPLEYGQSLNNQTSSTRITVNWQGQEIPLTLKFEPYQSLLYKIENGKAEQIDIKFIPKTPVVRKRPEGYEAPWLVK